VRRVRVCFGEDVWESPAWKQLALYGNMSVDLPIALQSTEPVYFCPGESRSVSRAIHAARLAARWLGCNGCPSRHDSAHDSAHGADYRQHAVLPPSVRRTRWGVRGPWQNAMTRLRAAQLAAIFTGHLCRQIDLCDTTTDHSNSDSAVPVRCSAATLTLIAGYDGRTSSPDIFAGVVSAAVRNGCNVIDVGRATAASVQEACRSHSGAHAAVIVTGAGDVSSATGFDFFDRHGNAVSVSWQDFDVTVRRGLGTESAGIANADTRSTSDAIARLQQSVRASQSIHWPTKSVVSVSGFGGDRSDESILELPPIESASAGQFRTSRTSGREYCRSTETEYRNQLRRWFPCGSRNRLTCVCFDSLVAERLCWLAGVSGITVDVVTGRNAKSSEKQLRQRILETRVGWGAVIAEDDRYLTVAERRGRCLSQQQLSDWMNSGIRRTMPHLTTHVPGDDDRVVMLETARPNQGNAHNVISDALAQLGSVCSLIDAGVMLP